MKALLRRRKLGSMQQDRVTGASNPLSISATKKNVAKIFAVGLLVSSILILAPTVLLFGGSQQKQIGIGGGGVTGTGLKPTWSEAYSFRETPALRDLPPMPVSEEEREKIEQGREAREKNEANTRRVKPEADPKKDQPFVDPALDNFKHPDPQTNTVTNPIQNFDGPDMDTVSVIAGGRFAPPDTNAAVGPNHVVITTNGSVQVFNKTGTALTSPALISTLLVGVPNANDDDGDPIVLYDSLADRWLVSQFDVSRVTANSTHQHIAISKTGDPTGAYYAYDFLLTANRPGDYPHLGVWPDGYYMTTNDFSLPVFSSPFQGAGLYAFERNKMVLGDPTAKIIRFNTNNQHGGMLPTNFQGFVTPPIGTPNLTFEFDADEFGAATDLIRAFIFHADFAIPANSTLTQGPDIPTAAFDARSPGTRAVMQQPAPSTAADSLDAIGDRLMHAVNYRTLPGGVQSYVLNFTVNVSGVNPTNSATYEGGVRWMELRRNAGTGVYTINQQATYAPGAPNPTGRDLWMASVAQDGEGNIGLAANATNSTASPALLNPTAIYTGRLAGDPANTLPQGEVDALSAVTKGVQTGTGNRWGDYSSLFVDPADECTFWGAFEYVDSPTASFDWNTRIFSFKVNPACMTAPRGTINGTITNCSNGLPILNAVITTPDGFFRQTNASGQFSMIVAPGTYTVTVNGPPGSGFGSCSQMVTVTDGGTATVNCCLPQSAIIVSAGATLVSESCTPANGVLDPNETVTVSLCVQNVGTANTTALMGTLQSTGGVTSILAPNPQNYGVVVASGPATCRNFTFTATGTCGGTVTATIHFVDGATDLGNVTYTFTLGVSSGGGFTCANCPVQMCTGITCPANITKANDTNQCGAVVTYPAPTPVGSGCGTITCSPASGSFFPKGTTTVSCNAAAGPSCSFTVTVNDTQPPTITCPAPIAVAAAPTCPPAGSATVNFTATALDNCPGVTVVCVPPSGSIFPVGTTSVTCTATDTSGNTATCSFTVTVFTACLVDESNSGNVVLFNTQTGDYRFCCNGVLLVTGRGVLTIRGCIGTIDDQKGDRKVHIEFDFSANNGRGKGTAALFLGGSTNPKCTITDQSMAGNACNCGGVQMAIGK